MNEQTELPSFVLENIGFAFGKIGEMSKDLYRAAIAPLGITEQHLYILVALDRMGKTVQAHLSVPLKIDRATMVGLLNDLEKRGLIRRTPHPSDRRAYLVEITGAGRDLEQQAWQISADFTRRFFDGLSEAESAAFKQMLRRVAQNAVAMLNQTPGVNS